MPGTFENDERVITMKVERISGCRRHLECIQYCFCFQSYLLLLWKWNKIEMSTIYIILEELYYIIICFFVCLERVVILMSGFVFSCIRFTTCTLLRTTQLLKKLDFYHFLDLCLHYTFITALEIFKVPILTWRKGFVLGKLGLTHH